MERCFRCGVSSDTAILYDAISEKEIIKVCEKCRINEGLPVIKKSHLPNEPEKRLTVRERLAYLSGFRPKDENRAKSKEAAAQDEKLKEIANKNYISELVKNDTSPNTSGESGMVRNFHWILMRERRAKHLTQGELAELISEPEAAIKMAEQGILPREHENLVKKIEDALKIKISNLPHGDVTKMKLETPAEKFEKMKESSESDIGEDEIDFREKEKRWTIGDLLRIKKRVKTKDIEDNIQDIINEDLKRANH